ncbi:MAG: VCBS domain-containing protein, partial [Rhodospirillales bacterium]
MAEESLQDNQDIFGDDPDRLADPAVGPNGSVLRSLTQNLAVDFGDSGGGFVRLTLPAALRRLQLTSDARPIRFVLGDEGQRIQGLVGQGGAPVLEIRLNNESGQYSYTFDLKGPVDDFDGDRIDLPVGIFLSDTDGNTVTGTFDLGIVDGEPAAAAEGLLEVEEGGWTLGSEAGGCNLLEDAGPGADSGEIVRFDYIDAEGNEAFAFAGERVETEHGSLTVDADGSWSFSANPDADLDGGRILDGFNYTIESGDGDKVIARKDLQIIEDGPAAPVAERPNAESVAERTIAESEAEVAEPETAAPASTDPASTDPASTDPASTDPASTDPASTDPASIDSASTDPDPGAMAESSVTLSIPLALEELNLTSSGEAVLFERSEDGRTITATTAVGAPVFVMSLTTDDDGGFSYDFDLQGPLDPPAAGSDVLADLPFGLTVVESDGARATATIHVDVVDDSSEGEAEGPIEPEDDHPISAEPAMVEPAMAAPAIDMEEAMSPSFPPELSGMQEDTADEPLADEPLADEPLTAEQAEQDSTVIAEPTVVIGPSGAGERAWIDLHIDMSAFEGPENILSITLEGLPGRAELSAGADNGDGTWTVPAGDVEGLRFRPPAGRAADYKLAVSATSFEPATGEVALARPLEQTVTVHVDAQGAPLDGSAEDGEAPEPDAEETLSGGDTVTVDLAIDASAFHTDGSEQTTFTISGVPKGGRLSAGLDNGDGSWTLEPGDREGLRMILPAGSPRLSSPGLSLPGLSLPGLSLDVEGRALHIDLDGYAVASGDETGDPTPNGGTEAEPSPIAADGEKDEVEHEDGEESEVEQDDDGLDHASPIIGIDADQVSEAGVADDIRGLPPITDNAAADPSTEVAATADVQIVLDDRGHAVQINVTVTVDVIFADTGEGGESHYVLVELPNGFTAPEGVEIVQGGGFVGLPDMTFIRVEIPAAVIVAGEGAVSVPVTLTALPDV